VAGADKLQRFPITFRDREVFLGGADYHNDPKRFLQLIWIDPPVKMSPDALSISEGAIPPVWVSEPFSRRFDVGKGDRLELPTGRGFETVEITGVYADYGSEVGTILADRALTSRWLGDDSVSQLSLYLEEGASVEELLESIREKFPELVVRTNQRLRTESIRIFHQTFAVTHALEAIAVIIAVAGLGLALAGLLLERRNDLTTLRSLGATRRNIAAASAWEGTGLALVGAAGGFVLSFLLGWILIRVINPQSFGWTLQYRVPWGPFCLLALLTVVTAVAVSWTVGYRAAHLRSDREE
jgi:putative ABC transport system permease protein